MDDTDCSDEIGAKILELCSGCEPQILDLVREYCIGGKMLRGKLAVYLADSDIDSYERALTVAACVEMVHSATLLHDDIIDNSVLRRAKNSSWVDNGVKTTILLGDMLICRALSALADSYPYFIPHIIRNLTAVCDAEIYQELISRGKSLSEKESMNISLNKTGRLFGFAALAALNDRALDTELLEKVGNSLGLAYQIADDCFDRFGVDTTWKQRNNDRRNGKFTLAEVFDIDELKERVYSILNDAVLLLGSNPELLHRLENYTRNEFIPALNFFFNINGDR